MKAPTRIGVLGVVAAAVVTLDGVSAHAAGTLCVGSRPGCFSTVQAAVDAAHDGDTIALGAGAFVGGVKIEVSVTLIGAGSDKTVIRGGGPVLTIGRDQAPTEPTVSIRGVTITGGLNNSDPDTMFTAGGGVSIPPAAGFATGATVAIADSVITGNRVTPQTLIPAGDFCGPLECAFALGGGIYNNGTLTLTNTRVTDNVSGATLVLPSVASAALAGGILNQSPGKLTLKRSFVTGNRSAASAPHGQSASSGGILDNGSAWIEDSVVSANSVNVSSASPSGLGLDASGGGIVVNGSATIARTVVHANTVTATNVSGDALAFAGGIHVDGSLVLTESTVDQNRVTASVPVSSGATVIAAQGGLSIGGVATVRNSLVSGNSTNAQSVGGVVIGGGGGVGTFGQLTLERTLVIGNAAIANGAGGSLQGGGISNFTLGGPPPQLTLTDSAVLGNRLSGSAGVTLQGGGLFTAFPVTLTRTVIAGNTPDQCFGC